MRNGIHLIPVGVTRPRHGDTKNRIRPVAFRLVTCVGFVAGIGTKMKFKIVVDVEECPYRGKKCPKEEVKA